MPMGVIAALVHEDCYADYNLPAVNVLPLTQNTYIEITNMAIGPVRCFELSSNALKKLDTSNKVLINGTSDLKVDKACNVKYGLYVNGVLVPGAETPVTFPAAAKTENISITAIANLNVNDLVTIRAWTDTAAVTATIETLRVTFLDVEG